MADQVTRGAAKLALAIALPLALVAGLVAFWQLGGFSNGKSGGTPAAGPTLGASATGAVNVPVPSLAPGDATMCLAFVAQLPAKLRDLPQRPVSAGGNQQNAAYGDPPITVACGGAAASYPPDAFLLLTGVCWYADQSNPAATVWTTLDRQVPIRVTIPSSYTGQGSWVQEFTNPIVAAVPSLKTVPTVCTAPSTEPYPTTS